MTLLLSVTAQVLHTEPIEAYDITKTATLSEPVVQMFTLDWDTIRQSDHPRGKFLTAMDVVSDSLWAALKEASSVSSKQPVAGQNPKIG
jgi:hypothetical protein